MVVKEGYGLQVSSFLWSHGPGVLARERPEWSLLKGGAWVRTPSYLHLKTVPWKVTVVQVLNCGNKEEGSFQHFKVIKP